MIEYYLLMGLLIGYLVGRAIEQRIYKNNISKKGKDYNNCLHLNNSEAVRAKKGYFYFTCNDCGARFY